MATKVNKARLLLGLAGATSIATVVLLVPQAVGLHVSAALIFAACMTAAWVPPVLVYIMPSQRVASQSLRDRLGWSVLSVLPIVAAAAGAVTIAVEAGEIPFALAVFMAAITPALISTAVALSDSESPTSNR